MLCNYSVCHNYMGDDFYRSKDPTNIIIVLKEKATKEYSENANNKIDT